MLWLLSWALVLRRETWTLIKGRAVDALTLVDRVHLGLDGGLLGSLGALFVRETGHGSVRLHDLGQYLDVILTNNNGLDSRLAIRSGVLA